MSALDGTITFTTPTARNISRIAANAKLKRRNHTKQKPPRSKRLYRAKQKKITGGDKIRR